MTGAGQGLGRSFAVAAAKAGAAVVVNDVDGALAADVSSQITAQGGNAIAEEASVTEWEAARSLIDRCVSTFGRIDGLINNAVAYSYFGPPWDEREDQIRREVEVAVLGTIFCGIHAIRWMREHGRGAIVNVTSRALAGAHGKSTYVACKGAIASVTYGWALDLMDTGVRVNALAPGAFTRGHVLAEAAGTYRPTSRALTVSPDLVAPAAVYLLSDLSSHMSGQVLSMLGGRLGLLQRPRLFPHVEERQAWTADEVASVVARVYGPHLQAVGFESDVYQWAEAVRSLG